MFPFFATACIIQCVRSISQAISFIVLGFSCTLPVRFPAFPRRKDWHVVRNIRNYRRGEGNKKLCALVVIDFNRDGGSQNEPNAEGRQRFPFSFPFWCPTTYVPSGRIQQALGDIQPTPSWNKRSNGATDSVPAFT